MTATPLPQTAADRDAPIPGWKWGIVWLMFLATMINYMDRQTLGSTSPHIMKEFGLNEEGYGWIEFAFQISFAVSQLLAGYFADRYRLRWLYPAALLVWSAAGFFTGLANTLAMLLICRAVLGFGEAFNWPCAVSIVGRLLPRSARSLANGIFHSGASVGAALTPLLVVVLLQPREPDFIVSALPDSGSPLILVSVQPDQAGYEARDLVLGYLPAFLHPLVGMFDWRFIFQLVGAVGLIWAVLWFWCVRGERGRELDRRPEPVVSESGGSTIPSFWTVFTLRRFWIALTVSTTVNICWHFYRVWLPRIAKRDLDYTDQEMLLVFAAFFVAADLGSLAAGYVTRLIIRKGMSVERARQVVTLAVALLCLLSIPAVMLKDPWISVPLILVTAAGAMGGFANMFALGQDISAPHTGKCVGILGAVPWFILAAMSPIVGSIVDAIGTFVPIVMIIAFVPLVGALVGFLWPPARQPAHP